MEMMMQTSPEEILDAIDSDLPLLLERLEREGDESGIAKGHMVAFQRDCLSGRMVAGARRARLAALYAGKAGDEGRRQRALGWYLTDLIWGTADARTLERKVDQIEQGRSGPFQEAFVDFTRGEICRRRGDLDQALRLTHRALATLETLGMRTIESSPGTWCKSGRLISSVMWLVSQAAVSSSTSSSVWV
jgi:hypothetical protein